MAQSAGPSSSPLAYSTAGETVIRGTISEVVAHPSSSMPLGVHLMVETAQGRIDVHLGPYAARAAGFEALVPGATIQVVGAGAQAPGGEVFLARTVTANGQTITLRNAHGLVVRQPAGGAQARNARQGVRP